MYMIYNTIICVYIHINLQLVFDFQCIVNFQQSCTAWDTTCHGGYTMDSRPYCWISASEVDKHVPKPAGYFNHVSAQDHKREVKTKLSKSFLSVGDYGQNRIISYISLAMLRRAQQSTRHRTSTCCGTF